MLCIHHNGQFNVCHMHYKPYMKQWEEIDKIPKLNPKKKGGYSPSGHAWRVLMANGSRPQSPSLPQLKYLSSFILPPQKVHFHLLNGTQWQIASCWWVIWTKWRMRETVGRKISCVLDSVNHALWFVQSKGFTEENTPLHTHCMKAKKQYHGWKSTLHKKRRSESVL